jgi:hypothetical protein
MASPGWPLRRPARFLTRPVTRRNPRRLSVAHRRERAFCVPRAGDLGAPDDALRYGARLPAYDPLQRLHVGMILIIRAIMLR